MNLLVKKLHMIKWQKNKWTAKLFCSYSLQGISLDTATYNYGSEVYGTYFNRPSDYGIETGQGKGVNRFIGILTADYQISEPMRLHAFIENQIRYSTLSNKIEYFPVFGIRSYLWNDYRNY